MFRRRTKILILLNVGFWSLVIGFHVGVRSERVVRDIGQPLPVDRGGWCDGRGRCTSKRKWDVRFQGWAADYGD